MVKRPGTTARPRRPPQRRIDKRKEVLSRGPPRIVRIHRLVYEFNYAC